MESNRNETDQVENILYELFIYKEWEKECEALQTCPNVSQSFAKKTFGSWKQSSFVPQTICQLVNSMLPWQFLLCNSGKLVAVIQEACFEIRTSCDEFRSCIGRAKIPRDSRPQWRKFAWSPDDSLFVVAFTNGRVDVHDVTGYLLYTIYSQKLPPKNSEFDLQNAYSVMLFSSARVKRTKWNGELILIGYGGTSNSFFLSVDGYQEGNSFDFSSCHPTGIYCGAFSQKHNLLLLSGQTFFNNTSTLKSRGAGFGFTAWRLLNDEPYFKLSLSLDEDLLLSSHGILSKFLYFKRMNNEDYIFKIIVSPDEEKVVCLHVSGSISLFSLPSLHLITQFPLSEQPFYDELNPSLLQYPTSRKKKMEFLKNPIRFHLVDANWWNKDALILLRYSGAVTVSNYSTLDNLLGDSPEFLDGVPSVSQRHGKGFLCLECENKVIMKRRKSYVQKIDFQEANPFPELAGLIDGDVGSEPGEIIDNEEDDESDDDDSLVSIGYQNLRKTMYWLTDSERFQPPRKKPKLLMKKFKLLGLMSTTPQELYLQKIKSEEYGAALMLAQHYNLDCDMVYETQWHKSGFTVSAIHDYLMKIKKRSLVLKECLECVPESLDATREMLEYGLRGTDLEALVAIKKGEDDGKFVVRENPSLLDDSYEHNSSFPQEILAKLKLEKEKNQRMKLLKKIDFDNLTVSQKDLIQARLKFLYYLDILYTYENILGGIHHAEERYDSNFYRDMRLKTPLEATVDFARQCDWKSVDAMFTFHSDETLPHRLAILSNFPETVSPHEYVSLLPDCDARGKVLGWLIEETRDKDWVEKINLQSAQIQFNQDSTDVTDALYEHEPLLKKYKESELTKELALQWYEDRTHVIESNSLIVEFAHELLLLASQKGFDVDPVLLNNLLTLKVLVYEVQILDISLEKLEKVSDLQKIELFLSQSTNQNFINELESWVIPFLDREDILQPGLKKELVRNYLLSLSSVNLEKPKIIFENILKKKLTNFIATDEECYNLLLNCLFAYPNGDQIENMTRIFNCLLETTEKNLATDSHTQLRKSMLEAKSFLLAAQILNKHDIKKSMKYLKENCDNREEIERLIIQITRKSEGRIPPLIAEDWKAVLISLMKLQNIFTCLDKNIVFEIFTESLLSSGINENIFLAHELLDITNQGDSLRARKDAKFAGISNLVKLPFDRSVQMVLKAAKNYFNSSHGLDDSCMEMAHECLNLISPPTTPIREELDLIAALQCLNEFNVTILPLSVRQCTNRINLVKKALEGKSSAYKNTHRLLKLAALLRVCGDDVALRDGQVMTLIAETALEKLNFDSCFQICEQLMDSNFYESWRICYKLAACDAYKNLESRLKLISYSLCHCSPAFFEDILNTRYAIECKSIYASLSSVVDVNNSSIRDCSPKILTSSALRTPKDSFLSTSVFSESDSFSLFAPKSPALGISGSIIDNTKNITKSFLNATSSTTRNIFNSVQSVDIWQTSSWAGTFFADLETSFSEMDNNEDFTKLGMHSFYCSDQCRYHESLLDVDYRKYSKPLSNKPNLEAAENFLRISLIESTMIQTAIQSLDSGLISKICVPVISEDVLLGYAYLFSLYTCDTASQVFEHLPRTQVSLMVIIYYYALEILKYHTCLKAQNDNSLYYLPPYNVIHTVYRLPEASIKEKNLLDTFNSFKYYINCLEDYCQAELLKNLDKGVDVVRFSTEELYKQDTIFGLAMSADDETYQVSLSLAKKYMIDEWSVHMTHLESLFFENFHERIRLLIDTSDDFVKILSTKSREFVTRMNNNVYSLVDGNNLDIMELYFLLINQVKANKVNESHLNVIRQLKQSKTPMNYKKLIKDDGNIIEILRPIVTADNVDMLAKLAQQVPSSSEGRISMGLVYSVWAEKYFFLGDNKGYEKTSDMLVMYDLCDEYIKRMSAKDFERFVHGIVFTEEALTRLRLECRQEILKKAAKFCKSQENKSKKSDGKRSWQACWDRVTSWQTHLMRVDSDLIKEYMNADVGSDNVMKRYIRAFDLTCGDNDGLESLLFDVIENESSIEILQQLLAIYPIEYAKSPEDVLLDALKYAVNNITMPKENSIETARDPEFFLTKVLNEIKLYIDEGGELLTDENVLAELRPFCCNLEIPVEKRLTVFQKLKTDFCLGDEDSNLLLLYSTQKLLNDIEPNFTVSEVNIGTSNTRYTLFVEFLRKCESIEGLFKLAEILLSWPKFDEPEYNSVSKNPWVLLLSSFMAFEIEDETVFIKLSSDLLNLRCLNKDMLTLIVDKCFEKKLFRLMVRFSLMHEFGDIHEECVNLLNKCDRRDLDRLIDSDDEFIITLLLQRKLVAKIVETPLYSAIVEFVIDNKNCVLNGFSKSFPCPDPSEIAKELYAAGFHGEAGSLLTLNESIPSALRTMSSSLVLFEKMFQHNA